jgi:Tfp pilus assembly protein PilZ
MAKFSTFLYGSSILYGSTLFVSDIYPESGPSTGGQSFIINGAGFKFTSYDDDFTGVILDPVKWLNITDGSGVLTTGASHLVLSTGVVAGSTCGIEMNHLHINTQYELRIRLPKLTTYPTSEVSLLNFSLYKDDNNRSYFSIVVGPTSNSLKLKCCVYVNGSLVDYYEAPWTFGLSTLKLLRWCSDIYFYANGSLIFKSERAYTGASKFRVYSLNNAAAYSVSNVVVESILSKTYVAFDNQVVDDLIVVSNVRARGQTPYSLDLKDQAAAYAGLVNIAVVSNGTFLVPDAYEYYFLDNLILVDDTKSSVKINMIGDSTVRTPVTSRKGLGGGK